MNTACASTTWQWRGQASRTCSPFSDGWRKLTCGLFESQLPKLFTRLAPSSLFSTSRILNAIPHVIGAARSSPEESQARLTVIIAADSARGAIERINYYKVGLRAVGGGGRGRVRLASASQSAPATAAARPATSMPRQAENNLRVAGPYKSAAFAHISTALPSVPKRKLTAEPSGTHWRRRMPPSTCMRSGVGSGRPITARSRMRHVRPPNNA